MIGAVNILTEQLLAGMIAAILNFPPAYVVPRQGNWWNPQDSAALLQAVLPNTQRPNTWCAFALEDENPIDLPHYVQDSATPPNNWAVQHCKAMLAIQVVGTNAKAIASSVGLWLINEVAQAQFALVDGRITGSPGRLSAVDFLQDGNNTVLAYTKRIGVIYAVEVPTGQDVLAGAVFSGVVSAS
jgi:hypothetical protein